MALQCRKPLFEGLCLEAMLSGTLYQQHVILFRGELVGVYSYMGPLSARDNVPALDSECYKQQVCVRLLNKERQYLN